MLLSEYKEFPILGGSFLGGRKGGPKFLILFPLKTKKTKDRKAEGKEKKEEEKQF